MGLNHIERIDQCVVIFDIDWITVKDSLKAMDIMIDLSES